MGEACNSPGATGTTVNQTESAPSAMANAPSYATTATQNPFNLKLQFSREEAATLLGISQRTLDRLIAEKELQVRRIGRRVLIPKDALVSFGKRDHAVGVIQ
jgi:excisionase family DNA binding protein